jgi:Flp pilus assembly protein TadG
MNRKAGTPPETKRIVQSRGFFRRPGILRLNVRRDAQGDEGAAMVEMALVCSLLLFMIFGIIEVSIGLYTYHYISDAAREGSRWAMVRGYNSCTNTPNLWKSTPGYTCPNGATQADISSYVKSLGYWSNDTNMTVTATWLILQL